jgi:RNA polymerase sigma-70 factor, ECF subfamily
METGDRGPGPTKGQGRDGGESAHTQEADAALIRSIANGDRVALAALYDQYAPLMFALAIRILRDRREAEDLLHDVFLEVWRSAADYDPKRGKVRTWLLIRMRSRALDSLKSARVSRRADGDEIALEVAATDDPSQEPDRARLRRVLAELPAEQRVVLELAYFEGLSCSEISTRLEVPIGTVKSRTAAALGKLRTGLQVGEVGP